MCKKITSICLIIFISASVLAQAPNKMSYQAVIRDISNNLVTNQAVGIRVSILQWSPNGTAVYVETHTPTTNLNGLASLEIGAGSVFLGSFSTIDWANGPYFIKTETDPTGGTSYSITGTSQMLSVPYALYAEKTANSSSLNFSTTLVFNGNSSTNWTDLDLSSVVGENFSLVRLKVYNLSNSSGLLSLFRQKGDPSDYKVGSDTNNMVSIGTSDVGQATIYTDINGFIQWKSSSSVPVKIEIVVFQK
jgi:hypothetical protein